MKFDNVATAQDSLRLKGTVFDTKVEDYIDTVVTITNPVTFAGSTTNVNLPKASISGAELELRYDLGRAFARASAAGAVRVKARVARERPRGTVAKDPGVACRKQRGRGEHNNDRGPQHHAAPCYGRLIAQ